MAPRATLTPLRIAVTRDTVSTCQTSQPTDGVKQTILTISSSLLTTESLTTLNLWKSRTYDRFKISLPMVHSRLQEGYLPPSLLPNGSSTVKAVPKPDRTSKKPMSRPLEDFEDLYYGCLAKIREIHDTFTLRLENGFNKLNDNLYDSGPTIAQYHNLVLQYWGALNDPSLVKTLDKAVRRARIQEMHKDILARAKQRLLTEREAHILIRELHESPSEIEGLAWIGGWAPGMIGAWLVEKYMSTLKSEKEDEPKKGRSEGEIKRRERVAKQDAKRQAEAAEKEKQRKKEERKQMAYEHLAEAERLQERGRCMREKHKEYMVEENERNFYDDMAPRNMREPPEVFVNEYRRDSDRMQEYGRFLRAISAADMGKTGEECVQPYDWDPMEF